MASMCKQQSLCKHAFHVKLPASEILVQVRAGDFNCEVTRAIIDSLLGMPLQHIPPFSYQKWL